MGKARLIYIRLEQRKKAGICCLPVQVVHIEFGTIGHVVTPFPFKLLLLFSFKFDNVVQLAVQ